MNRTKVAARRPRYAMSSSQIENDRMVDRWNRKYLVGRAVFVRLDDGSIKTTKTTSDAWLLGGHTAVIKVEGISGAYSLARVTAADPRATAPAPDQCTKVTIV